MNIKDIKLKSWPFDKGARVKLEWIGAPFRYEKKVVLPVYFSGKVNGYYKTEKLIVDWTVLTSLIIQHYYIDGLITKPIAPNQTEEIIITIDPNYVSYFVSPKYKKCAPFRYARRMANYPEFFRIVGYFVHVAWIFSDQGM